MYIYIYTYHTYKYIRIYFLMTNRSSAQEQFMQGTNATRTPKTKQNKHEGNWDTDNNYISILHSTPPSTAKAKNYVHLYWAQDVSDCLPKETYHSSVHCLNHLFMFRCSWVHLTLSGKSFSFYHKHSIQVPGSKTDRAAAIVAMSSFLHFIFSIYKYIPTYTHTHTPHSNWLLFHRSLPFLIILHSHHQHSSIWVSSALLNKVAQTQESSSGSVLVMGTHNNDFRIRLMLAMCRYVTSGFHLVTFAWFSTNTLPWDFFERTVSRSKDHKGRF